MKLPLPELIIINKIQCKDRTSKDSWLTKPQYNTHTKNTRCGQYTKIQMMSSEEDQFNKYIITLLSRQQDLQKQSLHMMQNMTRQHKYDN